MPDEFGAIVLRANPDGSTVRLSDVARIEVGGFIYSFGTRLNGKPAAAIAIQPSPTANALATAEAIKAKMTELAKFFPPGVTYEISYDVTPVITASVNKVIIKLGVATVLVFVLMYLFLQNIRYTFIPLIVVPIALLGTLPVLLALGFSLNVLNLLSMLLAIGILVDDAIVVVENVERIMAEEGLPPREATEKAMGQITGAVIGITLVLMSVFMPMAFFPGSVGIMYQQFSAAMVVSIGFSAFLALSLTPALCATLHKPVEKGHGHAKTGFFGWFNRSMDRLTESYTSATRWVVHRTVRFMLLFLVLCAALGLSFVKLPTGFVPVEDQGFIMADMLLPSDASVNRTLDVVDKVEKTLGEKPAIDDITFITGFSFFGQGANTAQAFAKLKDWSERGANESARAIVDKTNEAFKIHSRRPSINAGAAPHRRSRNSGGLLLPPAGINFQE